MHTNFKQIVRLNTLVISMLFLSGCYSFDQNKFCPFGKRSSQEIDYSDPIVFDARNGKIPRKEQKYLLKSSSLFSTKIINDTYDVAETLCSNNGLTTEQYQKLLNTSEVYINSNAVFPWTWANDGTVQQNKLHQAVENNDDGHIITETLCVVGICSKIEHEKFCNNRERVYLKNKKLSDTLTTFYLGNQNYKLTYPKNKSVSYCEGPQW